MYEMTLTAAAKMSVEQLLIERERALQEIKTDIKNIKKQQKSAKLTETEITQLKEDLDISQETYEHFISGFNIALEIENSRLGKINLKNIQNVIKKAQTLNLPLRVYVTGYSKFGNEKKHVDMLFDGQMINNLIALNSYLVSNGAEQLRFMEDNYHPKRAWNLQQVASANEQITNIVETIRLQKFSPFEAMAFIHYYITRNFVYNENMENPYMPRSIVGIYNSNDIVCTGYAALVKAIIDKLNMPGLKADTLSCLNIPKQENTANPDEFSKSLYINQCMDNQDYIWHKENLITIDDKKYNVKGKYILDACWDSKTEMFPYGKGFGRFLFPANDVYKMSQYYYEEIVITNQDKPSDDLYLIKNAAKHSKPIPSESYKNCIYNVLRKVYPSANTSDIKKFTEYYMELSMLVAKQTFEEDAKHTLANEAPENPKVTLINEQNQVYYPGIEEFEKF